MAQAKQADQEIAAGYYRGPLHGIPWGGKDLLDTTAYLRPMVLSRSGTVCPQMTQPWSSACTRPGAVLVAKLSMGALATQRCVVWRGRLKILATAEGASGSSAGPGSATAAGLVAFSIGSETGGSIVSPTMRCGITGLRPTYGRVPRTGAMTLCWSLDKLGP